MRDLHTQTKTEWERCVHLSQYPEESEELYGISGNRAVSEYYMHRAEGIGWVLDRMEKSLALPADAAPVKPTA